MLKIGYNTFPSKIALSSKSGWNIPERGNAKINVFPLGRNTDNLPFLEMARIDWLQFHQSPNMEAKFLYAKGSWPGGSESKCERAQLYRSRFHHPINCSPSIMTSGNSIWHVIRDDFLLFPKALYFCLNLVVYAAHAFQAQFFMEVWKLPIHEYGYMTSLQGFNFFGALAWSHVADKAGRPKMIMSVCAIVYCIMMCLLAIPMFKEKDQLFYRRAYAAVVNGTGQFFLAGCFPLLDALVMAMLARDPRNSKEIFGRQRLWGTFGHCAATYICVFAIWLAGGYRGMFISLVLCTLSFVAFIYFGIPSNLDFDLKKGGHHGGGHGDKKPVTLTAAQEAAAAERERPTVGSPTIRLLRNPHFLFFTFFILVAGYVRAIMTTFQSFFLTDVLHQDKKFAANAGAVRVITEVAVFFFGKQLMAWIGPYWMLILSQVTGIARILGYAVMPVGRKGWQLAVFPLELLKGLNTGLVVSAAVRLANDIAPRDCANTAQGFFSGVYTGLSVAVGGLLGGWLIFYNGGQPESLQPMFMVSAIITGLMTVAFALKYALVDRVIFTCGSSKGVASPLH